MVFESLLDPVFSPLLQLHPLWGIAIISLILTWIITLVYKWVTDQKLMKELKDDIKSVQKEMKEFKDNPAKVMEIQKKAMEKNMQYMMHSFKPMIFTLIPILIIFGWLNLHFAYEPLLPDAPFTVAALFDPGFAGNVTLSNSQLTFANNTQ